MRPLNHLILLSGTEPTAEDRRLLAFASSMGVSAKSVSIKDGSAFIQRLDEFQPGTYCLAISAETLARINNASISGADLQRFINEYSAALLVFGCTSSTEQLISAISWLTSGAVSGISPLGDQAARFSPGKQCPLVANLRVSVSQACTGSRFLPLSCEMRRPLQK